MSSSLPVRVGVIGCGNIAQKAYLPNLAKFPHLRVVACADLNLSLAQEQARRFSIAKALTPEALLNDPEIDLVINLTIPHALQRWILRRWSAANTYLARSPTG